VSGFDPADYSDAELTEIVHDCTQERVNRRDDPATRGLVTQWVLIGHVATPPTDDEGTPTQDWIHQFSDGEMASHVVLGLLRVGQLHAEGHILGLGEFE
jgi:hypothetical protein